MNSFNPTLTQRFRLKKNPPPSLNHTLPLQVYNLDGASRSHLMQFLVDMFCFKNNKFDRTKHILFCSNRPEKMFCRSELTVSLENYKLSPDPLTVSLFFSPTHTKLILDGAPRGDLAALSSGCCVRLGRPRQAHVPSTPPPLITRWCLKWTQ